MQLIPGAHRHPRTSAFTERRVGTQRKQAGPRQLNAQAELAHRFDPRLDRRVARARIEDDLDLHLSAPAPRDAQQLVLRAQHAFRLVLLEHRHEVGELDLAASREKARHQHIALAGVAALGAEGAAGGDEEPAAATFVEDRGKEGRAVEVRPAEPVE